MFSPDWKYRWKYVILRLAESGGFGKEGAWDAGRRERFRRKRMTFSQSLPAQAAAMSGESWKILAGSRIAGIRG
jgi:hypothetical protein